MIPYYTTFANGQHVTINFDMENQRDWFHCWKQGYSYTRYDIERRQGVTYFIMRLYNLLMNEPRFGVTPDKILLFVRGATVASILFNGSSKIPKNVFWDVEQLRGYTNRVDLILSDQLFEDDSLLRYAQFYIHHKQRLFLATQ